jgi:hypothetical protein
MPGINFLEYAQSIRDVLDALLARGDVEIVSFDIDQRSRVRGFLKGALRFSDNSELHFREFVDLTESEPRLMYAYHYADHNKDHLAQIRRALQPGNY